MKKIYFLIFFCNILVFSTNSLFAQIPTNGLVAYFPFSGNANNQIGSGIISTVSSGGFPANTPPVLTTDRNAVANSAYDFVPNINSTSYIDLGQPSQFNFGTSSSFSIALWMKFVDYQVSATMIANNAWYLGIRNLGSQDHLNFVFGAASFNSDSLLHPGNWVHVASVYNYINHSIELYINGLLATGFSYNGGPIGPQGQDSLSTSTFTLNGTPTGTTQFGLRDVLTSTGFKGVLDEVLIYNRALTATEVAGIFTATSGPSGIKENSDNDYSIFPNPNNGIFQLKFDNIGLNDISKIEIYNTGGEKILQQEKSMLIDLSTASKGVYFLKIYNNKTFLTKKIIIQ
ncbi:MAG: T9SS type A sorting domain-containing protein [Bacteroidetes bacterium]|nr:T9SS type A sorting domain-containing protein [Bacteroidota bacterium]